MLNMWSTVKKVAEHFNFTKDSCRWLLLTQDTIITSSVYDLLTQVSASSILGHEFISYYYSFWVRLSCLVISLLFPGYISSPSIFFPPTIVSNIAEIVEMGEVTCVIFVQLVMIHWLAIEAAQFVDLGIGYGFAGAVVATFVDTLFQSELLALQRTHLVVAGLFGEAESAANWKFSDT